MALGMGGLYGQDTAQLGQRQVAREAMAQRLSSMFSAQTSAREVAAMPAAQWSMYNNLNDQQLQGATVSRMRAIEGYDPSGSVFSKAKNEE
jgi:hypothetical protein